MDANDMTAVHHGRGNRRRGAFHSLIRRIPVTLPINALREVPTSSGSPSVLNSQSLLRIRQLSSYVLPKPIPGSTTSRSRLMPAARAFWTAFSRKMR